MTSEKKNTRQTKVKTTARSKVSTAAKKKTTSTVKKSRTAKTDAPKTQFQLEAPNANIVVLTGDFTGWDRDGVSLKKGKDGRWTTGLSLKPGSYQYRFIVDGNWWTDPSNQNTAPNPFGTVNSVVEVS